MAISEPKSAHLREVLLFAFNWKKSATKAHRMLEEVYGDHALTKSQCYSAQTQEKLVKQFQVSKGAVSLRLNSLGMTQKLSRWVPHELSERQQERRLVTYEGLLARHEKNNPTRQKSWGLPGQFPKQMPRPNRFGKKAMLCVWWDQTGVVYFELLKPGETHDNAPAHNATVVKNTIKDLDWELLPHPPYSPDLAPSDYHLFTSLGHALKSQEFSNSDILRKWLVEWFDSKGIEFFRQGIRKLPERWSELHGHQKLRKWCREFNEGWINVHDEQRSGRPSLPESTVARIDEMVRANRQITLEEIEDGLNEDCSHFSVHKIVSETLGYRKVSARWVDKWLKEAAGEWYNTGITKLVDRMKKVIEHQGDYVEK
ncbi:SETMAR [Cordylochernes scorpioides]|uniref:SETMAR n=1 Tax=Cordylochernes scorpioides TaxID=51811 RepID=A0ABY6KUC1_9ARAC|nr:SETMAR [Cordylochernes scorpioides]